MKTLITWGLSSASQRSLVTGGLISSALILELYLPYPPLATTALFIPSPVIEIFDIPLYVDVFSSVGESSIFGATATPCVYHAIAASTITKITASPQVFSHVSEGFVFDLSVHIAIASSKASDDLPVLDAVFYGNNTKSINGIETNP